MSPGEESFGQLHPHNALTLGGLSREEQLAMPYVLDLTLRAGQVGVRVTRQKNKPKISLGG